MISIITDFIEIVLLAIIHFYLNDIYKQLRIIGKSTGVRNERKEET
jgi:hypothetical protein